MNEQFFVCIWVDKSISPEGFFIVGGDGKGNGLPTRKHAEIEQERLIKEGYKQVKIISVKQVMEN